MSKAVYLHLKAKGSAPIELLHWTLAERFGWTLDYIDGLSLSRLFEFFQIEEGRAKAAPKADTRKGRRR